MESERFNTKILCLSVYNEMSDIGYRIIQSDIGSSNIRLSLISLITDIGLSAYLYAVVGIKATKTSLYFKSDDFV